jgi:hypothetical protein
VNFIRAAGADPAAPFALKLETGRATVFACAGVLAALNAQAGQILNDLTWQSSLVGIANLAGVSGVVWFALYAVLSIGLAAEDTPLSRTDWLILGGVVGLSILPVATSAKLALEICALYLLVSSKRSDDAMRVGVILLGLTGPLVWGRILLESFATPLLSLDAHLVAAVIRSPVQDNIVQFAGSKKQFLIGMPCSSVHNISLAIVLWTTAAALFRLRFDIRYVTCGAAMVAFMFGLNIARLSLIGLFPASFAFLHDGVGTDIFSWGALLGAGGIAFVGVTRAVSRQK